MNRSRALSLLRGYYVLTPLWGLAEILLKIPMRVGFFISVPAGRGLYYFGCMACGVAMFRWPRMAPYLGMGESALNIAILVVGLMHPIVSISLDTLARGAWDAPLQMASLLNFCLAGSVSLLSYYVNAHPVEPKQKILS